MGEEEPKPKRRSALRHALGGLALLVCIALGMWLIETAGWTNFGQRWAETQGRWYGPDAMRERVKVGMTYAEVTGQIGRGKEGRSWFLRVNGCVGHVVEEYPEYGFVVLYLSEDCMNKDAWKVSAVKDLSQADSPPWDDK